MWDSCGGIAKGTSTHEEELRSTVLYACAREQALANERSATGATPAAATGSSSSSSSAAAAAAAAAPLMGKTAASSSAAAPAYGALPPTTMLKPWGYSKLDP